MRELCLGGCGMLFYSSDMTFRRVVNGVELRPIRLGEDEDALRELADSCCGSFPYREYFENPFLLFMINGWKMTLICGFEPGGEMVCALGVRYVGYIRGACSCCMHLVRPGYEFLHAELDEIFMTLATQRKGLYSVYADVMAWDTERQEALARLGLAATGFRFMMYDGGLMPSGTGCERLSQVVMSLCLQEQTHFGPLYCPEEHIPAGMRIYDSAKARCLLTTRGCMPARQAWTDYIIVTNELHRNSWWIIRTVGLDFAEKLSAKLEQLGPEPESAFLCYLNMRSEGAEECWKLLRDSGFFLSGFKPANLDGEFAIFTYLGGRKLETADIQLPSENRWLLDYVLEHRDK